jgi:hypothetical protein
MIVPNDDGIAGDADLFIGTDRTFSSSSTLMSSQMTSEEVGMGMKIIMIVIIII